MVSKWVGCGKRGVSCWAITFKNLKRNGPGRISRAKEGRVSQMGGKAPGKRECWTVGSTGVGDAVRKQFRDDISDCLLKTSCSTQFCLESQVKNYPQLMDCVIWKHYKTTELTNKKEHLGSSFHTRDFLPSSWWMGSLLCVPQSTGKHTPSGPDVCSDWTGPYYTGVLQERGLRCTFYSQHARERFEWACWSSVTLSSMCSSELRRFPVKRCVLRWVLRNHRWFTSWGLQETMPHQVSSTVSF